MPTIRYQPTDYYWVDELFTDEHKLLRSAAREWVNRAKAYHQRFL